MARVCLYQDESLFPLVISTAGEDSDLATCRTRLKETGDQLDSMFNLRAVSSADK